jgi:hypothetical protein
MKKTILFIVKILMAAMVAMFLAVWADEHGVGYRYGFVTVYFCGAIGVYYAIEGICAFIRRRRQAEREDIIKFRRNIDYGQAAIFIGTACLFIGEPNECEELADYLQHYAQQAKARDLTGEETQFDIL